MIGKTGRNISQANAMDHVWGFLLANDVSQRDLQRAHGGQWLKGKSIDATMPIGPWVATADEIDWRDIQLECLVNGETLQSASTKLMAFPLPVLIEELSFGMTLRAGDLLLTGTPAGVGHARKPDPLDWRLLLHAWLALLAYATLAIAALLAIFLWAQERALRRREFHRWLRALPPLTELETLLFRTISVGFVLLGAVLLTGVLFVDDLLAQHLVHKTVLSVLSWLAFGALLLGRWRFGWRGATAVRWTLAAMVLLLLAFFGSKFVLELVLHRAS